MELEQVLFQSAQDQGVICAALKPTWIFFADDKILGIENASVDELERALPVRLGLLVRRFLGDEHRMHEQRLIHARLCPNLGGARLPQCIGPCSVTARHTRCASLIPIAALAVLSIAALPV